MGRHRIPSTEYGRVQTFKGILSWSANFLYVKELFLLSSETYFHPNPRVPSPSKLAKTENPGTSSALKNGYPEQYQALKNGYLEKKATDTRLFLG